MDPVTISVLIKIISIIIGGIAVAFSAYYLMRQLAVYDAMTKGVIDYDFTAPKELRFGSRLKIEGHMFLVLPGGDVRIPSDLVRAPTDLDVNVSLGTSPFKSHIKQYSPGWWMIEDWIYSAPGQEQINVNMVGTFPIAPGIDPIVISRGFTKTFMVLAPKMSIDVSFEPSRLTAGQTITARGKATFEGVTRENLAPGITPFAEIQTPWKVYQDIPIAEDGSFSFSFAAPFPGSYVITITANLYSSFAYVPPGWIRIYVVVPKTFTIKVEQTTGTMTFNPEDPIVGWEDVGVRGSTEPLTKVGVEVNGTERFEATTDASGNFAGVINRELLKRGSNDVRIRNKRTGEIIMSDEFTAWELTFEFEMPTELYYSGSEVAGSVWMQKDSQPVEFFAQLFIDGVLDAEGSAADGRAVFKARVPDAPIYPKRADYVMEVVAKYRGVIVRRTSRFTATKAKV